MSRPPPARCGGPVWTCWPSGSVTWTALKRFSTGPEKWSRKAVGAPEMTPPMDGSVPNRTAWAEAAEPESTTVMQASAKPTRRRADPRLMGAASWARPHGRGWTAAVSHAGNVGRAPSGKRGELRGLTIAAKAPNCASGRSGSGVGQDFANRSAFSGPGGGNSWARSPRCSLRVHALPVGEEEAREHRIERGRWASRRWCSRPQVATSVPAERHL